MGEVEATKRIEMTRPHQGKSLETDQVGPVLLGGDGKFKLRLRRTSEYRLLCQLKHDLE
jgi:hypothetical protein